MEGDLPLHQSSYVSVEVLVSISLILLSPESRSEWMTDGMLLHARARPDVGLSGAIPLLVISLDSRRV